MSKVAGILQFGSDHESVVGSCSMLTAASVTAFGTGSIVEAGATIDPVRGIKAGPNGAVKLTGISAANILLLDTAGQCSFDVETSLLGDIEPVTASEGSAVTNNTYLFSHSTGDGSGTYGRTWIDINKDMQTEANAADTHVATSMHTLGNGVYTRVTYSWQYGEMRIYYDGRYHGTTTRIAHTASIFTFIYLGSLISTASGASTLTAQNHYFKNFLLATQPVTLAHHPKLRNVILAGDSFASQADFANNAAYQHNNAKDVITAYLAERGFHINLTVIGTSGATCNDASGNPWQTARAAVLAANPDMVILQLGTNDASQGSLPPGLAVDQDDHISTLLAGTCKTILIGNAPTLKANSAFNTPTYVASKMAVNAVLDAAGSRWDAANPSDTGRVIHYDLDALYGGENPVPDVFTGQVGTTRDDNLHPSAKGQLMWGELVGKTIIGALR